MAHVVGVPRRDPCQKCKLPVFLAERLTVGKRVYHRTCLKCARCGSQLTPGSFYETEVDDEYCCETCPDEEEIDAREAGSSVQMRRAESDEINELAGASGAVGVQPKAVRSSIAERLAFFERSRPGSSVDSKLLQKSVSDEEKTKSLQRMEAEGYSPTAATAPPYRPNTALSNFLNDTIDGGCDGADSEPSSSLDGGKMATQMDTSDSEDETEGDLSLSSNAPPELPKTAPPAEEEVFEEKKPLTANRYTATAQLQLAAPEAAVTDAEAAKTENEIVSADSKDIEYNITATTPHIRKRAEIQLSLTEETIETTQIKQDADANDKTNNNGYGQREAIELENECDDMSRLQAQVAEAEPEAVAALNKTQNITQENLDIKLVVSPTNDNDCATKEKPADAFTSPKRQQSGETSYPTPPLKRELCDLESESTTDADAIQTVEMRTKPTADVAAEDVATTERLSVVRARLQQFDVIANNKIDNNNFNAFKKENSPPMENSIAATDNLTILSTPSATNATSIRKMNEDDSDETQNMPHENLEDEVKLKAIKMENQHIQESDATESLNEVPLENEQHVLKAANDEVIVASQPVENKEEVIANDTQVVEKKVSDIEIPTADIKEKDEASTKSSAKDKVEEYPEDLNPFKSDDDEDDAEATAMGTNKENQPQPHRASITKADNLNPFDSSDDEIELEKQQRNSKSSTPGKVPPPRPPPPRVSTRNPFGEDTEEDAANFSRHSSLSSSFGKKTPVPTPRTNLSQSQTHSLTPTPEPTPRLSTKTPQKHSLQHEPLQNSSDYYGSANSLGLQRSGDIRGSNNSLTYSSGGTIRSRKSRRAPAPPGQLPTTTSTSTPLKELFPSTETIGSSKASTPSSSTMGSPKMGRKKRPAPAPPKPARMDPSLAPQITPEHAKNTSQPKNLLSYPLQSDLDSKLSDEEKALLEGKPLPVENVSTHSGDEMNDSRISNGSGFAREASFRSHSSQRFIPLGVSLLEDDDLKSSRQQLLLRGDEETNVVYRRVLVPPPMDTPTHEVNPLLEQLNASDGCLAHDRQLEKLKDNKEAKNRNRQSQLSASSGAEDSDAATFYNKSAHGKWKRRKGPAPALPIPPRKVLQMLPLQEIRHELEIIEVQQQGLEKQGVVLEKMIRDRCEGQNGELLGTVKRESGGGDGDVGDGQMATSAAMESVQNSKEVEDLILQLFELVNEKNELFRRQAELMYLRRQHRLEQEQADLEYEIRVLMAQPERNKTDSDKSREEVLIARLVEVVQLRNEVIECLEMDRLREAEEDMSIKQRLELHTAKRATEDESKKSSSKLSKKEKKKQKEAKKLSKSKKMDADKDADETELTAEKSKIKKKKRKFIF